MKPIIDLHTHTITSGHAYSTIKENIDGAVQNGIKILGISDHAPNMPGSGHLFHFQNLRVIKEEITGVKILKGIEGNILDFEGNMDVSEELCEFLDYVIASLHPPCMEAGCIEENTNAIIKAMENKYVKIIAHPDDSRFPLDYKKIVEKAKETGTLLEINNSSLNPGGYREGVKENVTNMLQLCKEHNVKVIFGSDAHIYYDVGNFTNCINLIEELDFPKSLVVNYNEEDINNIFFNK